MAVIKLHSGEECLVDDEDLYLSKHKWYINRDGYACLNGNTRSKYVSGLMHRIIMDCPKGMTVDHINHNPLDNRKENLRICTRQQNQYNRKKIRAKSGYKGVRLNKKTKNSWASRIRVENKEILLGSFDCKIKAAKAYNEAALKYHGEFAYLNVIE